jgi:hypothetical protein
VQDAIGSTEDFDGLRAQEAMGVGDYADSHFGISLNYSLREKCFSRGSTTSAAEAGIENNPFIAAVNRCATQKHVQER